MENDMNTNANKKKYDAKADETAIFRVLALIFAAIVGFGALALLDTYKSKLFSYIMNGDKPVITVMTIVISVFALIAGMILQPEANPVKLIKITGCVLIFAAIILAQLPEKE